VIATVRGLVIAWALAGALVLAALVTGGHEAPPADRALVPGFRADAVTALAWTRDGAPPIRIARDPASPTGWSWEAPRGAADARTVEDALAALRGGRWHRRGPASSAGRIAATLGVTGGAAPGGASLPPIGVGEPLAGADQRWLAIGDRAYLVDAWLARALAPEPLALRVRRPLASISSAAQIQLSPGGELGRVTLAGAPRRVVAPFSLLLAPTVAAAIEQPLAELEVLELPRAVVAPPGRGIVIVADRVIVQDAGPCPGAPGRWAIDGTAGPGCVGEGAWENAKRAIWTLTQPPDRLALRRPAPLEPSKLTLPDGTTLDLSGHPRVGERDADPAAALELVAALGAPAEPVAAPTTRPLGALVVADRGGRSITLDLYAPDVVVRRGEPVGLRVGEGAFRRMSGPSAELVDPTPWREEPTTISALELDGTTYTRGAVLGEWARTGPGRDDPAAVSKLVAALAAPAARPLAPAPAAPFATRHTLTLRVQPPAGAPLTHTLRISDPTPTGCPVMVDDAPADTARLWLPVGICALVRSLTR
jgi:hypothetical protein